MSIIINKFETIPEKFDSGRTRQWFVNKSLGSTNTAVLENYFENGGTVPAHYHDIEEVLICLEGNGKVIADGKSFDFLTGFTMIIPPKVIHEIINTGEEKMRVLGVFPSAEPKGSWSDNK
jgi:quercetin dioxygenase-like cupin family protein